MAQKKRLYSHMTSSGDFDEEAAKTAQAKERASRGAVVFTRGERFNQYMGGEAQRRERAARNEATERGFSAQFDSKLGQGRKNRYGRGNLGIANQ